eukprot:2036192-Rhodomonas_salina.1
MAGLSPIHRHLKGYFALTQRIAALDPKVGQSCWDGCLESVFRVLRAGAREDLLDSYCRAVEPIAKNNVKVGLLFPVLCFHGVSGLRVVFGFHVVPGLGVASTSAASCTSSRPSIAEMGSGRT